ncbi:MAG: hypothetical protein GYB66_14030 [Chloroflexi bacterium]|nr:hypothetical protein [Chloroflexota bacterium]
MSAPHENRYSHHAKRSLTQGHFFARQHGHGIVDTDHLLVGIIRTEGSLGWRVLDDLELQADSVEIAVHALRERLDDSGEERLPFTEDLRSALVMALSESQALGSHYVGTEHFLLGLVRSGSSPLKQVLSQLEVSGEQIRGRVKRLVQQGISEITINSMRSMGRLSELGKRVLNAAGQVAHDYGQETITPHHVLLVLTQERRSVARHLLAEGNCDVDLLRESIADLPVHSFDAAAHLDTILDRALDRAEALGSHYTGTEHILLAMTLDPRSRRLLEAYDIDVNWLQQRLYQELRR